MANEIALFKKYINAADLIYQRESISAVLDGAPELVREGANADELVIPKIAMDGMADYSRNDGCVSGSVSVTFETIECNYDRGRMFQIDVLDDQETMGIAFGKLLSEFIRTKSIPEVDAFRFAAYAQMEGISTTTAAALGTGAAVQLALRAATDQMDNDEVTGSKYLFIVSPLINSMKDLDTTKSRAVLEKFDGIFEVPQKRFYTQIDLLDGKGENSAGGYIRHTGANNINFLIVEKSAIIQFTKHGEEKIVTPEANNDANAWKLGYRRVGIAEVYENKVAGIYLHKSTVTS